MHYWFHGYKLIFAIEIRIINEQILDCTFWVFGNSTVKSNQIIIKYILRKLILLRNYCSGPTLGGYQKVILWNVRVWFCVQFIVKSGLCNCIALMCSKFRVNWKILTACWSKISFKKCQPESFHSIQNEMSPKTIIEYCKICLIYHAW